MYIYNFPLFSYYRQLLLAIHVSTTFPCYPVSFCYIPIPKTFPCNSYNYPLGLVYNFSLLPINPQLLIVTTTSPCLYYIHNFLLLLYPQLLLAIPISTTSRCYFYIQIFSLLHICIPISTTSPFYSYIHNFSLLFLYPQLLLVIPISKTSPCYSYIHNFFMLFLHA